MARFLIEFPRWCLCLLLILTPWAHGGIPLWIELRWDKLCYFIVAWYVVVGLVRRNLSIPPWPVWLSSIWILGQGWEMTFNALYRVIPQLRMLQLLKQNHPTWPGTVNLDQSLHTMWKVTAIIALVYMFYDLSRNKIWRNRIIWSVLITGASLAFFGLTRRLSGLTGVFPNFDKNTYPFATFYYHGNAAAYMNTIVPIALAFFLRVLVNESGPLKRAAAVIFLLSLISGSLVCASKAGLVITIGLIILFAGIFWLMFRGRLQQTSFDLPPYFLWVIIVGMVVGMVVLSGYQSIIQRWQFAWDAGNAIMQGRQVTAQICLTAIPDAGWFGFGPGTFSTVFPFAAKLQHVTLDGFWLFAHEDYLQTVLEWGKLGALAWGTLFFGSALWVLLSRRFWAETRRYDKVLLIGLMLSLLGCAIHSLVDFPLQITAIELNMALVMGFLWSSSRWQIRTRVRRRQKSLIVPSPQDKQS